MWIFNIFSINGRNDEFQTLNNNNYYCHKKISKKKIINSQSDIYKYFSVLFIIIIIDVTFIHKSKDIKEPIISKDFDEEWKNIKQFMHLSKNNILIDKNLDINNYISENPKLSIVIPVYNGEKYIKSAITSIQNQDLKNLEIVLVDDFSIDSSVSIIREIMKTEPRIKLYLNEENKGILFTKSKGVYYSKGKYLIILDEDDIFGQRDALSTLYDLAEKDDLDMLGFSSMFTESYYKKGKYIHHYYETPIIFQPNISKLSHDFTPEGKVNRTGDNIWCYLFKTEIFNNTVFQINNRILKTKMICHEDYLFLFILTRKANKSRQIKRIFHVKITYGKPKMYTTKAIDKDKLNLFCQSYLNYIEFILIKSNNTIQDKKIASFEMERYFFNRSECQNNYYIRKRAIKVCKLFLKNKYIEDYVKKRIINIFEKLSIVYKYKKN